MNHPHFLMGFDLFNHLSSTALEKKTITVEPRFKEVAGDRPNLSVKWRVRYIENLDITKLKGKNQNVR